MSTGSLALFTPVESLFTSYGQNEIQVKMITLILPWSSDPNYSWSMYRFRQEFHFDLQYTHTIYFNIFDNIIKIAK